jgi:ComF family protein
VKYFLIMVRDFIALFFPDHCHGCYLPLVKGEGYICVKCISDLPKTNYHLLGDNPIRSKLHNLKKLQHALAYLKFVKGGTIQRLLHKIKYENRPEIGERLGFWYGMDLKNMGFNEEIDLILPVPLHSSQLSKRGYNQSSYFAAGLSRALEKPWDDKLILRIIKSSTQTKKTKVERWENVSGIFRILKPALIQDRHILLVDDVVTTGSTLEACAIELEEYCSAISVATIAMA